MMDKENLQLRRLGENDHVTSFDCGDEDLNDFILTDASLYYHVRLATSYVLEDSISGQVAGYFSLAHDRISLTDFPSNSAYNRFRKQFFAHGKMFKSYPALKICRLATSKLVRGLGIGSMMLNTIIESYRGDNKAGCRFMSPNKNNGYTPLVLLIPLSLKVSTIDDCRNFNVSHLLARTTITDIKKWRGDNLLPNPSIKRMNVVKNIA